MWSSVLIASWISIAWCLVLGAVKQSELHCRSCVMPCVSGRWCRLGTVKQHLVLAPEVTPEPLMSLDALLGAPSAGNLVPWSSWELGAVEPPMTCVGDWPVPCRWVGLGALNLHWSVCMCVTCLRSFWGCRVYPVDPGLPIQEFFCSTRCFVSAKCYTACLREPCWWQVSSHRKTLSVLNLLCWAPSRQRQNNFGISMWWLWIKLRITFVDYWAIDQRCTYYRNMHSSKEKKKKYWKPTL